MKEVTNKTTELMNSTEKNDFTTYAQLIKVCVSQPKEGMNFIEMKQRMKIIDVCDAGGEVLKFEDTDFGVVKTLCNGFKWGVVHKDIVQFGEDINEIK